MLAKVLIICTAAVATLATEYPADVIPPMCPNYYPFCNADALARYTLRGTLPPHSFSYAAQYPAGLNPALCPNYPFCDANVVAGYTPGRTPSMPTQSFPYATRYPAGLDPAMCPNYPFCDTNVMAGYSSNSYSRSRYTPEGELCPNYPYCLKEVLKKYKTTRSVDAEEPAE